MWGDQGGFTNNQNKGGGFQSPGGGFSSPRTSQGDGAKYKSRINSLIPVTVSTVLKAKQSDDNEKFVIDDIELGQVTILGIVRSVKRGNNRLDYEIDDFTAPPIEVKQFTDTDENDPQANMSMVRENQYVRVYGNIRAFGGKRNMVAFKMAPVTDANEITMHILECMKSYIQLTMDGQSTLDQPDKSKVGSLAPQAGGAPQDGLSPVQHQVSMVINAWVEDERGISVIRIQQELRGVPEKAIRDALEFLSNEGHIYSTIDEDHFLSTGNQ